MKRLLPAAGAALLLSISPAFAGLTDIPCDDEHYLQDVTRILNNIDTMQRYHIHVVEVYGSTVDSVTSEWKVCHAFAALSNSVDVDLNYWTEMRHGEGYNVVVQVGYIIHH